MDRSSLVEYLSRRAKVPLEDGASLYRVAFRVTQDAPEGPPAFDHKLTESGRDELSARLAKTDRLSQHGRWTEETLALIAANPRVPASRLAAIVERETLPFKADVRKLKRLGLTLSLEVGYELSPRGKAFLNMR